MVFWWTSRFFFKFFDFFDENGDYFCKQKIYFFIKMYIFTWLPVSVASSCDFFMSPAFLLEKVVHLFCLSCINSILIFTLPLVFLSPEWCCRFCVRSLFTSLENSSSEWRLYPGIKFDIPILQTPIWKFEKKKFFLWFFLEIFVFKAPTKILNWKKINIVKI